MDDKKLFFLKILTRKVYMCHLLYVFGVWLPDDSKPFVYLFIHFSVLYKVVRFSFYHIPQSLSKNAGRPSIQCYS